MKIALLDYRAGNLTSLRKALTTVGASTFTPTQSAELRDAQGIIVPGVGNFDATRVLDESWKKQITVGMDAGVPFLGICLGMQWLFEGSAEAPEVTGLGVLRGQCLRLSGGPCRLKVPHVGWNTLNRTRGSRLLEGVPTDSQAYFTHSYVAPITPEAVSITEHGEPFASAVERDHVFGVQFHPEKSGDVGLRVLRNFLRVCSARLANAPSIGKGRDASPRRPSPA